MNRQRVSCTESRLEKIKIAFDQTIENHRLSKDEEHFLPIDFQTSARYLQFRTMVDSGIGHDPKIKKFFAPSTKDNYLDVGSGLSLFFGSIYLWDSTYYGVDISPKIVERANFLIRKYQLERCSVWFSEAHELPFENTFFDIATITGVFEYFDVDYIKRVLVEVGRVLRPMGKLVFDIPNNSHPLAATMRSYESYFGRNFGNTPTIDEMDELIGPHFEIIQRFDQELMIQYFVSRKI